MVDPSHSSPTVLLLVRDLFFRVKLEAGLRRLGVGFRVAGRAAPGHAPGPESAGVDPPALVILDLADAALDPLETLRAMRGRPDLAKVPVVGYLPHGERERREAARRAGCTLVVSRSRIAGSLADVLGPFLTLPGA